MVHDFPPGIFVLGGIWAILCATILHRPMTWLNDRFDAAYYRWLGTHPRGHRFKLWIRANPRREWTQRGIIFVGGVLLIALGFTLGFPRVPPRN